jgi:hypothetical protein
MSLNSIPAKFELETREMLIFVKIYTYFIFQTNFAVICLSDEWICFWTRNSLHLLDIIFNSMAFVQILYD